MKDARQIVRRALLTEKGAFQREKGNQFIFEVAMDANKIDIKRAVEEIFDVEVLDVQTMIRRGKAKRMGRFLGKRPNWKRAIVRLKSDDTIDLVDQV
jgi:large subunit ribosomal protein L23